MGIDVKLEPGIDAWIACLRSDFNDQQPALLSLFETYAAEAVFGRNFVSSDLTLLPAGSAILEVGAGSMLLSCQLMREGFKVTALEPTGLGFTHFEQMQKMILKRAEALQCVPCILEVVAEDLSELEIFDYAFSINVMEHVSNVELVIRNVSASLTCGAIYRFTCPNYLFPYEPHFDMPTLFSKRFTENVFKNRIRQYSNLPDPQGTWKSLNWINVVQIRRLVKKISSLTVSFNALLLVSTFERIVVDKNFASRRSLGLRTLILCLVRFNAHRLLRFVPIAMQPIIDCTLRKIAK